MRIQFRWLVVAVSLIISGAPIFHAHAQTPDNVEERLPVPKRVAPGEGAAFPEDNPTDVEPVKPSGAGINRFVLTAVSIDGANAVSADELAPLYDDLLAAYVTVDDVIALADAITSVYREKGYFLSRAVIPAQDMVGGVLQINIVEGYIADVVFDGPAPAAIRNRLIELMKERPLRLATLDRTLALVGDLPGVSVAASRIEPNLDDMARHRFVVKIEQDRFEGSLYADNRGTKDAGPYQAYVSLSANSALHTGDQLSAGVFFIPASPDELLLAQIAYVTPIGNNGMTLTLNALTSDFNAGGPRADLEVESRTRRVRAELSYPIIRRRKLALWASAGVEARNVEEERMGVSVYEDRTRTIHASATMRAAHHDGITSLKAEATHGLDALDASLTGPMSRADATAEFTKFNVEFGRLQNVYKSISVYASLAGQYALDPLLASQEFSLGGARYGRAYDYGEFRGEDGIAGNVELRYGGTARAEALDSYQFYSFYDYGAVWNDNVPAQFEKLDLSSAGAGLRLTFINDVQVNAELAKPLDGAPFTQGDQAWRGFFNLSKRF